MTYIGLSWGTDIAIYTQDLGIMNKIKSCSEGKVGDTLMFDKSGYSSTITKVEKQPMGGVIYHLEDGSSISTLQGGWKYFTIYEQ